MSTKNRALLAIIGALYVYLAFVNENGDLAKASIVCGPMLALLLLTWWAGRCPSCKRWNARKITGESVINSSQRWHPGGAGGGGRWVTTQTVKIYFACLYCSHSWHKIVTR